MSAKLAAIIQIAPHLPRARRSKRHAPKVTAADLAAAARELSPKLASTVRMLNRARRTGLTDGDAFARIRWIGDAGELVVLRTYAERSLAEHRRRRLGLQLGLLALRLADGTITPERAFILAGRLRRDGWLPERPVATFELRDAQALRSRRERWRAAYYIVAFDADVSPRPSARRGLRGELRALFEQLTAPDWKRA